MIPRNSKSSELKNFRVAISKTKGELEKLLNYKGLSDFNGASNDKSYFSYTNDTESQFYSTSSLDSNYQDILLASELRRVIEELLSKIDYKNHYVKPLLENFKSSLYNHSEKLGVLFNIELEHVIQERNRKRGFSNLPKKKNKFSRENLLKEFEENGHLIFDDIDSVLENRECVNFLLDNKIPFSSKDNRELSTKISNIFSYISETRSFKKAGNPNVGTQIKSKAIEFAKQFGPIINEIEEEGYGTFQEKADELNRRGYRTTRDKLWEGTTVRRTQLRFLNLEE